MKAILTSIGTVLSACTLIICLVFGIFSLMQKLDKKSPFKHIVHNSCTGKWAIRVKNYEFLDNFHQPIDDGYNDSIIYFGQDSIILLDTGITTKWICEKIHPGYPVGREYRFSDSIQAQYYYDNYCIGIKFQDSLLKRQIQREDSIKKCENNYQ